MSEFFCRWNPTSSGWVLLDAASADDAVEQFSKNYRGSENIGPGTSIDVRSAGEERASYTLRLQRNREPF